MKKLLALAAAGALFVPVAASAAPSEMKVTGGGKTAAGETIAFVAQGNATSAKGQLQYNDHQGTKVHGTVTCVITGIVDTNGDAEGGEAAGYEAAGVLRDGTFFNVKGTDGGQPTEGTSSDTILFVADSDDTQCDLEPAEDYEGQPALANGNIKIHKVKSGANASKKQQRADMRAAKRTANASTFNAGASALSLTSLL